jgi:hypothetical protein
MPSNEETDIKEEDSDTGIQGGKLKIQNMHIGVMKHLNHFELAIQRVSMLQRASQVDQD